MIVMTEGARMRALDFLAEEGQDLAVRISVLDSSPLAPRFELSIIERWEQAPDDRVVQLEGIELVISADSVNLLEGASIDWVESEAGSGFHVELLESVPELTDVQDVTDHASGDNPYFAGR